MLPRPFAAALYEVAANLSGVEYIGEVRDAVGRPGLAVASTHDGIRRAMIFDPETAQLLGETEVLVDPEEMTVEVGPDTASRSDPVRSRSTGNGALLGGLLGLGDRRLHGLYPRRVSDLAGHNLFTPRRPRNADDRVPIFALQSV